MPEVVIPIFTPRLLLRELRESDILAVQSYAGDDEVVRYCSFGPNEIDDTAAFILDAIARVQDKTRTFYTFAIESRETGCFIGCCGLGEISMPNLRGELGYVLDKPFWGHGYATEAAGALLSLAFDQLELHRVYARAAVENRASQRVLEKLGMVCEGVLRDDFFARGRWFSSVVYGILREEFEKQQGLPRQ